MKKYAYDFNSLLEVIADINVNEVCETVMIGFDEAGNLEISGEHFTYDVLNVDNY